MNTPRWPAVFAFVSCIAAASLWVAQAEPVAAPADLTATSATATLRDPFWPVGYVHTNALVVTVSPTNVVSTGHTAERTTNEGPRIVLPPPPVVNKWDEAQKLIPIKGRYWDSSARQYMVSIGGKWHAQGEFVTVLHEGLLYRWRITELTKDNVRLSKVDAVPSNKGDK